MPKLRVNSRKHRQAQLMLQKDPTSCVTFKRPRYPHCRLSRICSTMPASMNPHRNVSIGEFSSCPNLLMFIQRIMRVFNKHCLFQARNRNRNPEMENLNKIIHIFDLACRMQTSAVEDSHDHGVSCRCRSSAIPRVLMAATI